MVSEPDLVLYACISKGTTILAEFNSTDAGLGTLAAKCLEKAPPLHTVFSHTIRNRTYTFLMDDPLVYFAIFDKDLHSSEGLSFLRSVKDAFNEIIDSKCLDNLNSFCFQGEFNPVFHRLLAPPPADSEVRHSPQDVFKRGKGEGLDSLRGEKIGCVPMFNGDMGKNLKKKKKKKRLFVDANVEDEDGFSLNDDKVDVSAAAAGGGVRSRELSVFMQKNGLVAVDPGHQKARRVWKKHVWVVLLLDLIVCCILFGVWLWVCRGFKCIRG
ncbi:phytolongin Phyl2.2 [Cornus florida]|uniref:phytolongin Phyl2.2 n=1 Tax=Cornus florida TaxID=4283 RepID=UPI00289F4D5B|nr:phytolongin Phyl2.2 [Cornus florida]